MTAVFGFAALWLALGAHALAGVGAVDEGRNAAGHPQAMVDAFRERLFAQASRLALNRTRSGKLFGDVVLVLQWNWNKEDRFATAPALRDAYSALFDDIVLIGSPVQDPAAPGRSYDADNPFGVLLCPGAERGFMVYECLSEVMGAYPGRSGYLLLHSDILVNWPQVLRLPLDAMWAHGQYGVTDPLLPYCTHWFPFDLDAPPRPLSFDTVDFGSNFRTDEARAAKVEGVRSWINEGPANPVTLRPIGYPAMWRYLKAVPASVQRNYHRLCGAPCNGTETIAPLMQMCDVFYVPRRFVNEFRVLSRAAFNANLQLELALPMIMCGMQVDRNADLIQLLGQIRPYTLFDPDFTSDTVYHQVPLVGQEGIDAIRRTVHWAIEGNNQSTIPVYGWHHIVPEDELAALPAFGRRTVPAEQQPPQHQQEGGMVAPAVVAASFRRQAPSTAGPAMLLLVQMCLMMLAIVGTYCYTRRCTRSVPAGRQSCWRV
ncbi:Uncharacterized protein PBTT_08299 [Plasmodiophora brassicae]